MIFRSLDYSLGLMLVHLEPYLVVNDIQQFYQIVLTMYQMVVCLGIFLNVQMAQINVDRFLLRVIHRSSFQYWFYCLCFSIDELSEAMPSFYTVLDDAWLGASLIATSDDSLVVRN